MTRFQITQIRYPDWCDGPVWDSYPVLFASLEDARAHYADGGEETHFEHIGGEISISELDGRGVEIDSHLVAAAERAVA